MIILDTNLWVFGTLGTDERPESLLDEIERGQRLSAINAYVLEEALAAFDRTPGLTSTERDEIKTRFLTRLTRMAGLLEVPSSHEVSDTLLADRRRDVHVRLLGRVLDVQSKDVPVLVLAFFHSEREPTILTNDASFADLTPADHRVPEIAISHCA